MVDPDPAARQDATQLWQGRTEASVLSAMGAIPEGSVDVITLCTPTEQRGGDVEAALALRPKVLIVEKPLASGLPEAARLKTMVEDAGVVLRVNYNRRFDRRTRDFVERFPGTPQKIVLRYGRGLYNYASHMIDLLMQWFGPIATVQSHTNQLGRFEHFTDDLNIDFWCRFQNGIEAVFIGLHGLAYDQFDIDIYFADQRLSYLSGGAEQRLWRGEDNLYYQGYRHLAEAGDSASTGQIGGFRELYDNIREYLELEQPLAGCNGADAILVQTALAAVVRSAKDGGTSIELHDFLERYEKRPNA
jgi:predicted dehydrogenase